MRHVLAQILAREEVRDPAIAGHRITVTEVRISPDLRNATVFVVPLGGTGLDELVTALNHAGGFFRNRLGQEMRLRFLPKLRFAADHTFDEAARIESILERERVKRDLTTPAPEGLSEGIGAEEAVSDQAGDEQAGDDGT
jgi:ribosome-binding factor A